MKDPLAKYLSAAEGLFRLGLIDEAIEELRSAPQSLQNEPELRLTLMMLYRFARNWKGVQEQAEWWVKRAPDDAEAWIALADSLRNGQSLQSGLDVLQAVADRFPNHPHLVFQLACYECQMNHLDEARRHVRHAVQLDPAWLAIAQQDSDLKPLWPELSQKPFTENP